MSIIFFLNGEIPFFILWPLKDEILTAQMYLNEFRRSVHLKDKKFQMIFEIKSHYSMHFN